MAAPPAVTSNSYAVVLGCHNLKFFLFRSIKEKLDFIHQDDFSQLHLGWE